VITEGADRLRDGARVTLPGDAPRAPPGAVRRGAAGAEPGARAPTAPAGAAGNADGPERPRRRGTEAQAK